MWKDDDVVSQVHRRLLIILLFCVSSIVFSKLRETYALNKDYHTLCIYCDYTERYAQTVEGLLLSLMRQLIGSRPPVPKWIHDFYEDHYVKEIPRTLDGIKKHLVTHLKMSCANVFIVVDGLDECHEDIQAELFKFFLLLSPNVRILIMTRSVHLDNSETWDRLALESNEDDMRKYIENRIKSSRSTSKMLDKDKALKNVVKQTVLSCAAGIMLLAKLHMNSVTAEVSLLGIEQALERLPKDLESAFHDTLLRIEKQPKPSADLARRLLMWVIGAQRPLSLSELQIAVVLELTGTCFDVKAQSEFSIIMNVCGGLLTFEEVKHLEDGWDSVSSVSSEDSEGIICTDNKENVGSSKDDGRKVVRFVRECQYFDV